MRKMAAYALFAELPDEASAAVRHERSRAIVDDWLKGKGTLRVEAGRQELHLKDGRIADLETSEADEGNARVSDYVLLEPANEALVRTQVSVGRRGPNVAIYVELEAAGGAYRLGPMRVDIRSPGLVRMLVDAFEDWTVGASPVSTRAFDFFGRDAAEDLAGVIWNPRRNLPLVVVSDFYGDYLTESLAQELATDLVGVALIARVDAASARRLSEMKGKEWSCYNGAVRLYWPGLAGGDPHKNPLWLRTSLLANAVTPADAASKLRRQLRRQLLGLSGFSVTEPQILRDIRQAHTAAEANRAQQALREQNDWEGLASLYADENKRLVDKSEALEERVRDLETQVASLELSLRWRAGEQSDIQPDEVAPPSTITEAVDLAKKRFAQTLLFGSDVDRGLQGVATDAGPPEKVLWYLEQLSKMVQERNGSGLGEAPIKWLQKIGVNASGESETIRNSPDERRRRTWDDGGGQRFFDLHLKPTDAAHPDRCVRIYFDFDQARRIGVVGWVGRHP